VARLLVALVVAAAVFGCAGPRRRRSRAAAAWKRPWATSCPFDEGAFDQGLAAPEQTFSGGLADAKTRQAERGRLEAPNVAA
jgi:hypothetical protein